MDFLHLKSPGNWINDPNGFIFFNGKYHIFYQHFPYEPVWGTMHWGHAESTDLVNWEHKGIALYPSKSYDRDGVFSGNAIEIDGKMYLYYTGISYPHPDPENIHVAQDGLLEACQVLLVSEDGEHFDNYNAKRMVIAPGETEAMSRSDTRDPKVWKAADGSYRMILGSTYEDEGRLIFMESSDAYEWRQAASYTDRSFGTVYECPDLFCMDGQWVMFCAATDHLHDGKSFEAQEIYRFAEFDEGSCALKWQEECFFPDYGTDIYATQTALDEEGRRVLIGWMRMPEPMAFGRDEQATVPGAEKSSGLMTMPRVISLRNGHLYFKPHPNIDEAFGVPADIDDIEGFSAVNICDAQAYTVKGRCGIGKISVNLDKGAKISLSGYIIEYRDGRIVTDRSAVYPAGNHRFVCETPELKEGNHLDIYVDRHIIEIYANGGEYVLSSVIYKS